LLPVVCSADILHKVALKLRKTALCRLSAQVEQLR
jgi:hypothetical protein